jgi:hypothetical protein
VTEDRKDDWFADAEKSVPQPQLTLEAADRGMQGHIVTGKAFIELAGKKFGTSVQSASLAEIAETTPVDSWPAPIPSTTPYQLSTLARFDQLQRSLEQALSTLPSRAMVDFFNRLEANRNPSQEPFMIIFASPRQVALI